MMLVPYYFWTDSQQSSGYCLLWLMRTKVSARLTVLEHYDDLLHIHHHHHCHQLHYKAENHPSLHLGPYLPKYDSAFLQPGHFLHSQSHHLPPHIRPRHHSSSYFRLHLRTLNRRRRDRNYNPLRTLVQHRVSWVPSDVLTMRIARVCRRIHPRRRLRRYWTMRTGWAQHFVVL